MKTGFIAVMKRFFVCIVACSAWPALSATQGTEAQVSDALASVGQVPDFTCTSAAGEFWPVEVRYTSADGLLYVKVSQPAGIIHYRLPYPGSLNVDTANLTSTGFVLTASRPLNDKAIIQAAAIPSAYGPYTVTTHLDLKINVYQRFIKDINISNCSGYPQM